MRNSVFPTLSNTAKTFPERDSKVKFISHFQPHKIKEGFVKGHWRGDTIGTPQMRFYYDSVGFDCNHKELLFWEYIS